MIKLSKQAEPKILSVHKVAWTAELLHAIASSPKLPKSIQNRYNEPEIKDLLLKESNSKCMYCESLVGHVAYEHIEHIKPKARAKYPELSFEWSNLGLACPKCNLNKSDDYDEKIPFINPYIDDPLNHFLFLGILIRHKPGDLRAELTEKTLKLNRPELLERRNERFDLISEILDKISSSTDSIKKINTKILFEHIDVYQPYSSFLSKYVESCGLVLR